MLQATVIATIQSYIDAGCRLYASHEVVRAPSCSHSSELDLIALRDRLGGDFSIPDNRAYLLSLLRCAKCGRKGDMSIMVVPGERRSGSSQGLAAGAR
jgi:hypothetical protein